ncbi:hypothetical protein [Gemmobacter sp. 24YEA27]|uniref:hypothetical protein n=1 Tax=Gemmobacter sp. 24YEA27 TaxID=3040672 RepID=UPI0024B3B00C|nr:hypothetical protein [Gemmobacter sp. 24YEA27]
MTRSVRFATGQSGAISVDWLVLSAAAFALAAAAMAMVNSGVLDLASEKLAQIVERAVDEVGNDTTDRKLNYTQGCTKQCTSK